MGAALQACSGPTVAGLGRRQAAGHQPAARREQRRRSGAHLPARTRRRQRRLAFGTVAQRVAALVPQRCPSRAHALRCEGQGRGGVCVCGVCVRAWGVGKTRRRAGRRRCAQPLPCAVADRGAGRRQLAAAGEARLSGRMPPSPGSQPRPPSSCAPRGASGWGRAPHPLPGSGGSGGSRGFTRAVAGGGGEGSYRDYVAVGLEALVGRVLLLLSKEKGGRLEFN
jgi:hypothetical protein